MQRALWFVSSYYRPQNSSSDSLDHLSDSIRRGFAKEPNHPYIIMGGGDFNLGDIDWDTAVPTPNNLSTASRHQKFLQIIDYSFSQHVKASTRPIIWEGPRFVIVNLSKCYWWCIECVCMGSAITLLLFFKLIWILLDPSSLHIRCIYITKLTLMAYEN